MVNFPSVEWILQDPNINPSGNRHLKVPASGFIKIVDTSAGGVLDFGQMNTTGSGAISDTKLVYARISDMGDASGIFHMRFFLTDTSSWGAGTYRFLENKQVHFVPNLSLTPANNNTPLVVPSQTNLSGTIQFPAWQGGTPWLSGVVDQDVSQYIYLAVEANSAVPVGTYGGAGAGTFRFRLLYDFS